MKKIYIYETSHSRQQYWTTPIISGRGLIKIGETCGDIHSRIMAQLQGYPCTTEEPYVLLYSTEATTQDGTIFSDKLIHSLLELNGVYRYNSSEWFGCTVEEVITQIDLIKQNNAFKYFNGNIIVNRVATLLSDGLPRSVSQIAAELALPSSYISGVLLRACPFSGCKLSRRKKYDSRLHKNVYHYTLAKSTEVPRVINNIIKSDLSKRYQKFIDEYNLDTNKCLDIFNNARFNEAVAKMQEYTNLSRSACEKATLVIRKVLVQKGLIFQGANHKYIISE